MTPELLKILLDKYYEAIKMKIIDDYFATYPTRENRKTARDQIKEFTLECLIAIRKQVEPYGTKSAVYCLINSFIIEFKEKV